MMMMMMMIVGMMRLVMVMMAMIETVRIEIQFSTEDPSIVIRYKQMADFYPGHHKQVNILLLNIRET